jgi:murein DD-endopeptidase MepM/ murein hydrolase activator NlpD
MANTTRRPRKSKPKSLAGKWLHAVHRRLFCKRSIIIISEHKTQHVPFNSGVQVALVLAALAFVGWASFSSGSYMAAQRVLQEKEKKLASTTQENERVEAEFTLLKSDLLKLADESKTGKTGEAAKQLAEQYSAPAAPGTLTTAAADANAKYDAVFKRIEFLENKVKELQQNHDAMMADIRTTTGGKIKELEHVIAQTGINEQTLEQSAEAKRNQDQARREKYGRIENGGATPAVATPVSGAQGGPYEPVPASVLKEKETELYFNLQKMMTLNDIVQAMPLIAPMASNDYHQTSGFGTRVDPFRGTLAFHSGLDFAGPTGSRVIATQDGRVQFAGWKTAYGNVIDIKHEYGISTRYAHLSRVLVQPDQFVKKGQVIGIEGSTGRSTGDHVHYEVRYNDQAINPGNFLKAGDDVRALD